MTQSELNTAQLSVNMSETALPPQAPNTHVDIAAEKLKQLDKTQAVQYLANLSKPLAAQALRQLTPTLAADLFFEASAVTQESLKQDLPTSLVSQWELNRTLPEGTVGRLMDPPVAVYQATMTVEEVVANLRELVKREFVTYVYVASPEGVLEGLVVMRDLLFARPEQKLGEIMLKNPYALRVGTKIMDAMKDVLVRHFPVYPVVSDSGQILGLVRGFRLFEAQAFEISAQAGSMVGVEKGERLNTHWRRSLKFRHPWLQLNLLTAFIAGAVVSFFQGTIDQIVVLAAFLPVLAGQSGNTGCQALAVTLRGITMGELENTNLSKVVGKEALLGLCNGLFVGLSAGLGMYILARGQGHPDALLLSGIVLIAMIGSCFVSGISGALVPLLLRKIGADPATASSIFLTTATDVASMGLLLGLATLIML